ncbi:DDE_3 domain-containing protein [Trichonephila clavipes]|nr:DDE_3 domain-containing protein [Trichonephila clavipes]
MFSDPEKKIEQDPESKSNSYLGVREINMPLGQTCWPQCKGFTPGDASSSSNRPKSVGVSTGFLPTSGNLECDRLRRVIFSDESRFSLSADDHRTRVWRRTGQRSDPAFIVERHTAISQGVTVWGAISWDTRSSLVVLQGTLTARRYVDDILTPIVLPMLSSRPGAIYQQDNARPHTARLSQQCLQDMTSYHGLPGHQIFRQ